MTSRRHRAIAVLALAVSGAAGVAEARAASLNVSWDGKLVCVAADSAFRADLLREVARKTGTKISGIEHLSDRVTMKPSCADLGTTLRMLAGSGSYALTELASSRPGAGAKYQLFMAEQGRGRPLPNLMARPAAVSVLVEDPLTGAMRPVAAPTSTGDATPVRPDETPVSVRVDPE